ncbi:hypothetical protein M5F66_12945 [Acinetobacter sp. ANC 5033]|uniref:hypothetical protein n=1 Tax=Acinetobacter amyesii TaxID=2942470 RepID=UPI00201B9103|nr:hypothetical protein [Acinetobacter amyesii]MCL6239221.1 hypothetical protein [Acinetobacter amyesii]
MLVQKKYLINFYLALFSFFILGLFAVRNPFLISDGDNYVMHATLDIDFSLAVFFTSPLYWFIVKLVSIDPLLFPSLLSLLIAFFISLSALKLKPIEIIIFIFFIIVNPIFFTTFELALRNGLALSIFIFLVVYKKDKLTPFVCLIHPGILPVVFLYLALKYLNFSFRNIVVFISLIFGFIFLFDNYFSVLLEVRGYSDIDDNNSANFLTYLFFFFLSFIYYKSFNNVMKFYMPLFFIFWVFLGLSMPFAARVFVQAVPFFVILIFLYSENNFFKKLFLFVMVVFSILLALKSHDFIIYNSGWVDTWVSLFYRYF